MDGRDPQEATAAAEYQTALPKTVPMSVYQLPVDNKERDRLSLQHRLWCAFFGGLHPRPLHDAITERNMAAGGSFVVLDVGCGSGIWAVEMGNGYPQAQIIGVDLVVNTTISLPSNVQFREQDIVQEGLPPAESGYDIIHARTLTGYLKDPTAFVQAAYSALKPGGLLILADAFKPCWDDKSEPIPLLPNRRVAEAAPPPTGSWWAGWIFFWHQTCYTHYQTVATLIEDHPGLSHVHRERYYAPMHRSCDKEREELGHISNSIALGFCRGGLDAFVASGEFTRSEVEGWIKLIEVEFETKSIYTMWDIAWGVKLA
ncbi:S-adenosyl-L-methionine-dependent methyltransferase [Mycena alexandri]|uniref:S-adenosyl-L-methionine-dependent methyltransferase n=1 Tax=Mycena alexandri TaxID=1745969 RepID=A0AAD6SKM0_9AGAR|nr:S-adenosyl-L-methionine-dependent methyltransferase [Mycena alexandri]